MDVAIKGGAAARMPLLWICGDESVKLLLMLERNGQNAKGCVKKWGGASGGVWST